MEEFICSHGICAMLCGHSHHTLMQKFEATSAAGVRDVHELRAGSATQLDVVPIDWITWLGMRPVKKHWRANAVLVHSIYETRRGLEWQADVYARGRRGFRLVPKQTLTFRLA